MFNDVNVQANIYLAKHNNTISITFIVKVTNFNVPRFKFN